MLPEWYYIKPDFLQLHRVYIITCHDTPVIVTIFSLLNSRERQDSQHREILLEIIHVLAINPNLDTLSIPYSIYLSGCVCCRVIHHTQ